MNVFDRLHHVSAGNRIRDIIIFLQLLAIVGVILWKDHERDMETTVCIVGGSTSFIGRSDPAERATEYNTYLARKAAVAMFDRNPDGSYEEWGDAARLLAADIQANLIKIQKKDESVFRLKQRTQRFITEKVGQTLMDKDNIMMMVKGSITDTEIEAGEPTSSSKKIRMMLHMIRNVNWVKEGSYLWVVKDVQEDFLPPA